MEIMIHSEISQTEEFEVLKDFSFECEGSAGLFHNESTLSGPEEMFEVLHFYIIFWSLIFFFEALVLREVTS
jgi:hypothetical protein